MTADCAYWLAGRRRRRARRVPDAADCASPGLDGLFSAAEYRHPATEIGTSGEGLLLIEPRMRVLPETLTELAERCAECGYIVRAARRVPGAVVASCGLAEQHYLPHADIARTGSLDPWERARLLALYDRAEFHERYGVSAIEVDVEPAERFCRVHEVPLEVVRRWSRTSTELRGIGSGALDGPNEIGDCKFVNVFQDPRYAGGRPVFLLNPHMIEILEVYEDTGSECVVFHLEARSPHALPWRDLRRELCGATDPARALPGSLRGDSFAGFFPLRGKDGSPVTRWNNGLHMSNGAAEAIRELRIWFGVERPLSGLLLERAYLQHLGRRRVLGEVTNGLDRDELARVLRLGRLVRSAASASNRERTDRAWEAAKRLRSLPGALAVIGLGLGFRDPEAELLVISEERRDGEVRWIGGEWWTRSDVDALLGSPEPTLAQLRRAARIGNGVPLWDPHGLVEEIARRAAVLAPPRAATEALLERARLALEQPTWTALRTGYSALALVMLTLHPLRFDRARWASDDLRSAGEAPLAAALLRARRRAGTPPPAELRMADALLARGVERFRDVYGSAGEAPANAPLATALSPAAAPGAS